MQDELSERFQTLHEFVAAARQRLDERGWDYLIGGTETETTVRRNRHAIESLALRPRVLNDVSSIKAEGTLLGRSIRLPLLLAPVGGLETFDPGAGLTVAEAAGRFGIPFMLSSVSKLPLEDVRAKSDNLATYQLYVRGDEDWVNGKVEHAMAAGYDAFCLTVDTAVYSRRERDITKRFAKPWRAGIDSDALRFQAALSWPTVERLKSRYDIPLILKGIATPEDATIAVEHGVDVIYVSNHGGRQLDHGRGTLDMLPEIVDAVGGRARILVDGGFCRGTDIVKAIALGADAVGIGRLYCYAMAAAGVPGIVRMLEILENEIVTSLGLLGVTDFSELSSAHIATGAPPLGDMSVFSAFPLLAFDG